MAKLLETDIATRTYRVANGINQALCQAANEPSLGMYRLQEHVSLTVPKVVEQRLALHEVCQQVEGACYDLDYDTEALRGMRSITQFASIKEKMRRAIELKSLLDQNRPTGVGTQRHLHAQRQGRSLAGQQPVGEREVQSTRHVGGASGQVRTEGRSENQATVRRDSVSSEESTERSIKSEEFEPRQFD